MGNNILKERYLFLILGIIFCGCKSSTPKNNQNQSEQTVLKSNETSIYDSKRAELIGAEFKILAETIFPENKDFPTPEGYVDENSPFLHYPQVDISGSEKNGKLKSYFFRLSKNESFTYNLIESAEQSYSFYNPYRVLSKGKWYWQCGVKKGIKSDINWSKVFVFEIRGNERKITAPNAEEILNKLAQIKGPRIIAKTEHLGHLIPEKGTLREQFEALKKKPSKLKIPKPFITPESAVPTKLKEQLLAKGNSKAIFTYRTKRTRDKYKKFCVEEVQPALKMYFLTKDTKHRQKAIDAFVVAKDLYEASKKANMYNDFIEGAYEECIMLYYDIFSTELGVAEKKNLVSIIGQRAENIYGCFIDNIEHKSHNSHNWQVSFQKGMFLSLLIVNESDKAKGWVKYFYDLWMFRGPNGSRNDGGWFPGNGYVNANENCLISIPFVLKQITDYDYFQIPWYQNVMKQFALAGPAGTPAGAYGDKADQAVNSLSSLARLLYFVNPNNIWNVWRFKTLKAVKEKKVAINLKNLLTSKSGWYALVAMKGHSNKELKNISAPQQAAQFKDIGLVTSHSNLNDISKNISVSMRSSPYGQLAHAHASQNAFNITAGGEKLFFKTGFYTSHADAHSLQSYKHTRAQNSILVDGCGQDLKPTGYGWIARYTDNKDFTYAIGDASNAYNGKNNYLEVLKKNNIDLTKENGFGDTDVTRFRRHMLFLKPNYVVIYDELEAENPVSWTFRLNAPKQIYKIKDNSVEVFNTSYTARASLYSGIGVSTDVTNKFKGEFFDWQGKLKVSPEDAIQWHTSITTEEKVSSVFFLTIIDISKKNLPVIHTQNYNKKNGMITVNAGDFTINSQLDTSKKSYLYVSKNDGSSALSTGVASRQIKTKNITHIAKKKGTSLVLFNDKITELVDELPDALKYGNLY